MEIIFERRRVYVAPRKSVLFFARVGDRRVRCYVRQDALNDPPQAPREDMDVYQRCLLAFDDNKDLIQAAARRLIEAQTVDALDAVVVSSTALALETTTALP